MLVKCDMATDPASVASELTESTSLKRQKDAENLFILSAILTILEDANEDTDSECRTLIEQLTHATATDVVGYDKGIECLVEILRQTHVRNPRQFASITKVVADGSRNESWRTPLCSIVLDFYLDLLAEGGDHPWTTDALRLVGNCCIDSDTIRSRVLQKLDMASIFDRFHGAEQQSSVAIGVLYNLCLDYEPAQQAARKHRLFPAILHSFQLLLKFDTNNGSFDRLFALLDFAVQDLDFDSCSDDAILTIYDVIIAAEPDFDDTLSLCNAVLALLASERYQKLTIARGEVPLITTLFDFSYTQDTCTLRNAGSSSALYFDHRDIEREEALSELRSILTARLWDISTQPELALSTTLTADLLGLFRQWLSQPQTQRQLCACAVFRNLTVSHGATANLIQQTHIEVALVDIMKTSSDLQLLEEALRLYRNLAIHPEYRMLLAKPEAIEAITALWHKFSVQVVQYAAVRVIRQLLTGETRNVQIFLTIKPQHLEDPSSGETYIARLMYLYSSTNDLATRMEIGQIVVTLWRVGANQKEAAESEPNAVDNAILQAKMVGRNIAEPVMALTSESENESLVTQGWLGLALMAGSAEGCKAVTDILCLAGNLDILRTTLLENEEQSASKKSNNAGVLIRLLKQNHPALPQELVSLGN